MEGQDYSTKLKDKIKSNLEENLAETLGKLAIHDYENKRDSIPRKLRLTLDKHAR